MHKSHHETAEFRRPGVLPKSETQHITVDRSISVRRCHCLRSHDRFASGVVHDAQLLSSMAHCMEGELLNDNPGVTRSKDGSWESRIDALGTTAGLYFSCAGQNK